ncbi:MAG TPA: DUF5666 domain-containing protein [Candidatus Paceibacterota bacterium]|nr:DUF5666 domain-containing protein [Candidatus Paceibacterota bacterium]
MTHKKLFIGILALALAVGGVSIARADNDREKENRGNDSHQNEREARLVGSSLEVHITDSGKVLVRGAKVASVSGSTITATTTWGSVAMNWTVTTDSNTKLLRRYGGSSAMTEIAVGDFISFQGNLVTGTASPMTVLAKTIKDWSVQKKNATFEGTVSSISGTTFVLATKKDGNITVSTVAGTQYMKNGSTGAFADIAVNGKVAVTGLYNNLTHTLEASKVSVKTTVVQPQAMTKEGKLVSIAGTTAPTSFVIKSGDTNYTVRVSASTSILKNNWLTASLANFVVDNTVRVYGVVNADNTIDATVVRNTNL